jgi:hypothetical protein
MKPYRAVVAAPLLGAALLAGCTKEPSAPEPLVGKLAVNVENVVGPNPLVLDTRTYTSPAGEPYTVSIFNYYLSNFRLHRADGTEYAVPNSYFLIREGRPGSSRPDGKHFELDSIPVGEYTGLSFLIGVDEERNTAGAQTGPLSPDNHMFWTWSQGYIFLQMEGYSPRSGDAGTHLLAYHIGDFRRPNNLRVVAPPLPGGARIHIKGGRTPAVQLRADVQRLFVGAVPELSNPILFGPFWTAVGGPEAGRVATNYSGSADRAVPGTNSMFTITAVRPD